jgi:heme/copper-type cytochrome/quinol oxidase subunit 3
VSVVERRLPTTVDASRSTAWWGMVWFIAAELALFGTFLASYFYLRFQAATWPPDGIEDPNLVTAAIMTVLLLSSSLPMWWGERGIKSGDVGRLRLGLALSMLLGLIFLALASYEFASAEFSWRTDAYGSLFFFITGFHAAHVLGGLLMNGTVQVRAWRNHFDREHHVAVEVTALYWHFVDAVWIAIVLSLYVSPYLRS